MGYLTYQLVQDLLPSTVCARNTRREQSLRFSGNIAMGCAMNVPQDFYFLRGVLLLHQREPQNVLGSTPNSVVVFIPDYKDSRH